MTAGGWVLLVAWVLITFAITALLDRRIAALEKAQAHALPKVVEPPTDEFPVVEPDTVIAHPAATQVRQQELLRPVPYAREGGRHRK